ncbi:MAG: response regulator [Gammaproteobacteria bacterium]|jgi:DNA-binding NtrC family response regulator|nr:response regulator [Gammaproteobacteria bacterium]
MANEHVLLVDDEEDFVEALSTRMEARGLVVEAAKNGYEALEKAQVQRFDAIIMDLAMPGMDGVETLRGLRVDQPELQVIFLTGHGTLETGVEAMKLGAMDFLEKPTDINLLIEKVRKAGSKTSAAREQKTQQMIEDVIKTKGW